MEKRRALVVLSLWLVVGSGFFFASTLEEDYTVWPGWLPPPFPQDNILNQHRTWHGRESSFPYKGLEFLEFHREFLAQSDDFRIYGFDADGNGNPDAAVIPVVALNGGRPQSLIVSAHVGDGDCPRPAMHRIDDGPHYNDGSPCDPASATCPCNADSATWTDRPPELRLHTPVFHNYSAILLGLNIQRFHTQGHGALGRHKPAQMITVPASPRDGAFYQWHKNIDNIYADWAVGKYRLVTQPLVGYFEKPIFFSVSSGAVGRAGSALNVRSRGDVYRGLVPAVFDQYGARPRIGSDIYVGRNDGSNLLYAPGTKEWNTLNGWDVDAWTILNAPQVNYGWYFSVAMGSVGRAGSAVANPGNAPNRGDVFETCADGANTNTLLRQQDELGLAGTNELDADELDALEYDRERRVQGTNDLADPGIYDRSRQWFSLRRDSTHGVRALGGALVSPSDILRFDPGGNLLIDVAGAALGLGANDDLDALAIVDVNRSNALDPGDLVYYSLDRISPALGAAGDSAADILCRTQAVAGGPWVACAGTPVRALALGLDSATDDLDALDLRLGLCPLLASPSQPAPSQSSFPGACCRSNGTCSDNVMETTGCMSPDRFLGEETVCATALCPSAPGACCAWDGTCQYVSDYDCSVTWAGTFRGPGTTCPPNPACPTPPSNDECVNASVIPYNFASPYQIPSSDNTNATEPPYFRPKDPPYSCHDHDVFADAYGSGTIWYSYTVPTGPEPRRSIYISTQQSAQHYPGGGAGDTRIGMYYAPNGDCSVLQEVACADNIIGDNSNLALYAPLRYNNPAPGKYYIQVSTTFNVDRGQTYLAVSDPPAQPPASVPTVTTWGLVILTLVLIGWGYTFLPRRKRPAV